MAWHDDSWKDGYDAWRLASPDEYPEEECFHEDYEADINGRAHCGRCQHSWWLSPAEIEAERERVAAYDELMRKEERRLWWLDLRHKLTRFFWRPKPAPIDDDVPF